MTNLTSGAKKTEKIHLLKNNCLLAPSMYDQDGNGWIDLLEMTRIVKSIYSMMGPDQVKIELLVQNGCATGR